MIIREKIAADIKAAMKSQDKVRLNALRNISSTFLEYEKEKSGNVVTDEVALSILSKLEKKRKESIELYERGSRPELAEQERLELAVIQEILPEKLSDSELEKEISEAILREGFSGRKDLGQVMKVMMKDFAGRVDGNSVRKISERLLGS